MKENAFKDKKEFGKIRYQKLKSLNVATCPAADELGGGLKIELLMLLEGIEFKKLNKEYVTKEDFEEAKKTKIDRILKAEEDEKDRKRQEEDDKKNINNAQDPSNE